MASMYWSHLPAAMLVSENLSGPWSSSYGRSQGDQKTSGTEPCRQMSVRFAVGKDCSPQ